MVELRGLECGHGEFLVLEAFAVELGVLPAIGARLSRSKIELGRHSGHGIDLAGKQRNK
jgi:hypothetical protein